MKIINAKTTVSASRQNTRAKSALPAAKAIGLIGLTAALLAGISVSVYAIADVFTEGKIIILLFLIPLIISVLYGTIAFCTETLLSVKTKESHVYRLSPESEEEEAVYFAESAKPVFRAS